MSGAQLPRPQKTAHYWAMCAQIALFDAGVVTMDDADFTMSIEGSTVTIADRSPVATDAADLNPQYVTYDGERYKTSFKLPEGVGVRILDDKRIEFVDITLTPKITPELTKRHADFIARRVNATPVEVIVRENGRFTAVFDDELPAYRLAYLYRYSQVRVERGATEGHWVVSVERPTAKGG